MAKRTDSNPAAANIVPGRFAYQGLERVLHEKARLGIMTSLVTRPEGLLFNELKRLCELTDGNLSRHLDTLREAGLVELWKGFENKRPQTLCRLSRAGRDRFLKYLAELERVVHDVQHSAERKSAPASLPPGWVPV
jgi:DNA-binding transcriptional ArsR family regulator